MDDSSKADFALAIGGLFQSFGREITTEALYGYWMGLGDLDLRRVQFAVVEAIRSMDHLPAPVQLRRLAGEKSPDAQAMAAWDDAVKAVISLGPYKHVNFADRFINATIRNLGGWPTFIGRFTDSEAEKWLRLEFIKAYRSFSDSRINGEICEPLSGLAEAQFVRKALTDDSGNIVRGENGLPKIIEVLDSPRPIAVQCATPTETNLPRIEAAS